MPINPISLENLNPPWEKGKSPKGGRPSAGASIRNVMNTLVGSGAGEKSLKKIARDKDEPVVRRMAAIQLLKAVEVDDLADFDGYIDGSYTLSDLRDKGIDTSVVKRAKVSIRHFKEGESETTREVEVRDRASDALDKIIGLTAPTMNEQEKNDRLDQGKATEGAKIEVVYVDRIKPKGD